MQRPDYSLARCSARHAPGRVLRTAVFETSDDHLATSALRAIRASEPFEIPPDAVCLAGIPIVGTFTNPARR